jgi:pilus assembly protein CpaE
MIKPQVGEKNMTDRILIVDDDVQTLHLIGLMLERQGYKILKADNGFHAMQVASMEQPDVIILDVMMPDLDGFEVTRRLRQDAKTAAIPILMFTSKTEMTDKLTGFAAGADDYLTKPIHPTELIAHLSAILERLKAERSPKERGYVIGILAAKGGVGASTLALNLAIALRQKYSASVIAAEMVPGQGTWGFELGSPVTDGLDNLLNSAEQDITVAAIANQMMQTSSGVQLLLASPSYIDAQHCAAAKQMEEIVETLPLMGQFILLDLGTPTHPCFDMLLDRCNELLVVTEPFPTAIQRTRRLIQDLEILKGSHSRPNHVVIMNRVRTDLYLSSAQIQAILGTDILQTIPPAPEIAFQAAHQNLPLIEVQGDSIIRQQFFALAEKIGQRILA